MLHACSGVKHDNSRLEIEEQRRATNAEGAEVAEVVSSYCEFQPAHTDSPKLCKGVGSLISLDRITER